MAMCKTYLVLSYNPKGGNYNEVKGTLEGMANGNVYSTSFFHTYSDAVAKATEIARSGYLGIIYESKEFHQTKPVPIVVEGTTCCDPQR